MSLAQRLKLLRWSCKLRLSTIGTGHPITTHGAVSRVLTPHFESDLEYPVNAFLLLNLTPYRFLWHRVAIQSTGYVSFCRISRGNSDVSKTLSSASHRRNYPHIREISILLVQVEACLNTGLLQSCQMILIILRHLLQVIFWLNNLSTVSESGYEDVASNRLTRWLFLQVRQYFR